MENELTRCRKQGTREGKGDGKESEKMNHLGEHEIKNTKMIRNKRFLRIIESSLSTFRLALQEKGRITRLTYKNGKGQKNSPDNTPETIIGKETEHRS